MALLAPGGPSCWVPGSQGYLDKRRLVTRVWKTSQQNLGVGWREPGDGDVRGRVTVFESEGQEGVHLTCSVPGEAGHLHAT